MLILTDDTAIGQFVSEGNRLRQYDYLRTSFAVSQYGAGLEIDHEFIGHLNFYASQYLSPQPGRYRRHYNVSVGQHHPSDWSLIFDEMEDFINILHRNWARWDPLEAAAYALWGVNHVHPFCEGNGRTSRALCYFVLCKKLNMWLQGSPTIIELIRTQSRDEYCDILQRMHDSKSADTMDTDLREMVAFLDRLLLIQIRSAQADAERI